MTKKQRNSKNTYVLNLIILVIIFVFGFGCKKQIQDENYFPHGGGSWWRYQDTEMPGYFIREFSGNTLIGNINAQNWVKTFYDTAGTQLAVETNYVLVTDTMVLFYEDIYSDPYIYLKFPLEVDSAWTFLIDDDPINARIDNKEDLTVPAGTFSDVWLVRYDDPENEETRYIYYAPNVGIVRDYAIDYDSELVYEEVLLDYQAKQ